jgi:glycosyltransferase involved in cell wall biosynthesis
VRTVVLVHQREILHYRIAIYSKLNNYLAQRGWRLVVLAQSLQADAPQEAAFEYRLVAASFIAICKEIHGEQPDAVISFVNAKELYLFPMLLYLRMKHIPCIYWGHGVDLDDTKSVIKRVVYACEHAMCSAVLLYSENQRQYLTRSAMSKSFVARNTIDTSLLVNTGSDKGSVLAGHGIHTSRNVICVGRMQRRKRIPDLIAAFEKLQVEDCGLILVGPDVDGCIADVADPRIYTMGAMYGPSLHQLLEAADVFCLPGHVGLSIVDAMHFGLPFVTEDVNHAPEIMYLQDGVNGYIVPAGDVEALAGRLSTLLTDRELCRRMSAAARRTVREEASLDRMFAGFSAALDYSASS